MSQEEIFDTVVGASFQGWTPGFRDEDDRYYVPNASADISKTTSFSLRANKPMNDMTVYDQGALNSCVANACSLVYWYELRKASDKGLETSGPSRFFLWWNALKADTLEGYRRNATKDSQLVNTGTWNRHAMKLLNKQGVCPETLFKYLPEQDSEMTETQYNQFISDALKIEPTKECYDEAEKHTIKAYYRLDADRAIDEDTDPRSVEEMNAVGELCLDNVKRCLLDGHPVVFAFRFYWPEIPWDKNEAIWSMPDIWSGPKQVVESAHEGPSKRFGGHAVVAIGYDDSKKAILCQNSWGKDPSIYGSQGGLFYMPYLWVKDFAATNDFWTCRLSEGDKYLSEAEVNARVQDKMKAMAGK